MEDYYVNNGMDICTVDVNLIVDGSKRNHMTHATFFDMTMNESFIFKFAPFQCIAEITIFLIRHLNTK